MVLVHGFISVTPDGKDPRKAVLKKGLFAFCSGVHLHPRIKANILEQRSFFIVQELCESRGGRPGLSVLTSLLVSVDVKLY